ncbi:hypothetical protein, partial [Allorhodopirellula heiligendammensis]|uniref:hypothetical protein n=1 Tax=Allorhodopirellula heiligendammensis TaxID=2714739 RepID=UPI00265DCA92
MQHRKSQAIDGKNRGQELQSIAKPNPPKFVRVLRQRIITTGEGTSDTSLYAMDHWGFGRMQDFTTSSTGHRINSR